MRVLVSRREVAALGLGVLVGRARAADAAVPRTSFGVNANRIFLSGLQKGGQVETGLLETLGRRGIAFVRFAASAQWAGDWLIYEQDPQRYWLGLDRIFGAAERSGVRLVPSVLWSPVALTLHCGETMQAWRDPKSRTSRFAHRYVESFVSRYDRSPAMLMYEFGNELNDHIDDPAQLKVWPKRDPTVPGRVPLPQDLITGHDLRLMVQRFAATVRQNSRHLIGMGSNVPRGFAWHMARGNRDLDTRDQFIAQLRAITPPELNVLSIHLYDRLWPWPQAPSTITEVLNTFVETAKLDRRISFLGEFGVPRSGNVIIDREMFAKSVALIQKAGIDYAAVWNVTAGPFQPEWDITDGGDREYQLALIADANRSLAAD
jgi:diadenosine tetraphosphatase ApaH/serine/threonine PP2A family protein phosphatase